MAIYLDHAADTPMLLEARDAMVAWLFGVGVGNANSIHSQGWMAKQKVDQARKSVAKMINAYPDEIYFTANGTDSNRIAHRLFDQNELTVLTTRGEHESNFVGHYVLGLEPDGTLLLDKDKIALYDTDVVSVFHINNETGSVNQIERFGELCRGECVLFHVDAVQAAGHFHIDVQRCNIDTMSMSAHKFGGPQGIGILYVRNEVREKLNFVHRPGTENIAGIIATGVAAKSVRKNLNKWLLNYAVRRSVFLEKLGECLGRDKFRVNGGISTSNIISLTIFGVHSESLLLALDADGLMVSAGAACSSGSGKPSRVLTAMGLSDEDALCTIRISMGTTTTVEDVVEAAKIIANRVKRMEGEELDI